MNHPREASGCRSSEKTIDTKLSGNIKKTQVSRSYPYWQVAENQEIMGQTGLQLRLKRSVIQVSI